MLSSLVLTSVFGVEAVKEVGRGVAVAAGQVVGAAAAAAHAAGRLDVAHAAGRLDVDAVLLLDAVGLTVAATAGAHAARVRGRAAVAAAQVVRRVVAARRCRVSRTCRWWFLFHVSGSHLSRVGSWETWHQNPLIDGHEGEHQLVQFKLCIGFVSLIAMFHNYSTPLSPFCQTISPNWAVYAGII